MLPNYLIFMHPGVIFDINVLKLYSIVLKLVFEINCIFYEFCIINLFFYDSLALKTYEYHG